MVEELVVDIGKVEEFVKSECMEEVEEGLVKGKDVEVVEVMVEGVFKVEKKEGGSGRVIIVKSLGVF